MQTRSSVLGKRVHQESSTPSVAPVVCEQLQTPEPTPNPKRARTTTLVDDDSNKENIPPHKLTPTTGDDVSPRAVRALRRTVTEGASPSGLRAAPRRHASMTSLPSTPQAGIQQMAIVTPPPTPPTLLMPLHARVRALLRSTCNNTDTQIAGRANERASILNFLSPFFEDILTDDSRITTSMFISGTPGTGKTALVNAVIRELPSDIKDNVKIISINCMSLKDTDTLWARMIEEFNSDARGKSSSPKKLKGREGVITLLNKMKLKCILILDELDHITQNAQGIASIFSLTESLPTQLRLIGIANTHTLTSSSASSFVDSADVTTIHFAPYTPAQLQEILESRLKSLSEIDNSSETGANVKKLLPAPTLMLLTKKVAALTGDVRSLFEVLRGAIDIAAAGSKSSKDENIVAASSFSVVPQNILAALKAYAPARTSSNTTATPSTSSNSETVTKIRNLGLQSRLCLLTVLLASQRVGAGLSLSNLTSASPKKPSASPMKRTSSLPNASSQSTKGIEISGLHTYYTNVLSRIESGLFEAVSRSEFADLLGVLEGNGIVTVTSTSSIMSSPTKARKHFSRSVSFGGGLSRTNTCAVGEVRLVEGIWGDEVLRGLGVTGDSGVSSVDSREEEVRGIWEREMSRFKKDVKNFALSLSKNGSADTIAGAFED